MKLIPIVDGKHSQGQFVMVDDEDYERLSQYRWYMDDKGFAIRTISVGGKTTSIKLHREIMGFPTGWHIDHADHNRLNCQRSNLRLATRAQNNQNRVRQRNNTSGFRGVSWDDHSKKWLAYLRANGKRVYLGLFEDRIEAARAWNEAALKHHGEFAWLNPLPPS